MDEEQEYLNHIAGNPDNDDLKLIYADWLDERGDERGHLIRLSVEMRRIQERVKYSKEWLNQLDIQRERKNTISLEGGPYLFWKYPHRHNSLADSRTSTHY